MRSVDDDLIKNNLWDSNDININEESNLVDIKVNNSLDVNGYSFRNNENVYFDNDDMNYDNFLKDKNHVYNNFNTDNDSNNVEKKFEYHNHRTNTSNTSPNFIDENNTTTNNVYSERNPDSIYQEKLNKKDFNLNEEENKYENNMSGKMNILGPNSNINDKNNYFELLPFIKNLNNIRTKLLCYYDIDNDIIIYRCMCALLPYMNVDKRYNTISNFNDIENNINEMDEQTKFDKYANNNENENENENVREISNVNDAFDYYDDKLSIERNPDIYGFIWLNLLVCFTSFVIFNASNIFTDNIHLGVMENDIDKANYVRDNKFNIMYNIFLLIFLFNISIPILIYITSYLHTKKGSSLKLVFLISLMSYNNIILFPLIFLYKITNFESHNDFFDFLLSFIHVFLFFIYVCSSTLYIYKFTKQNFKNNFTSDLIYIIYAIFLVSYICYYFLLKSYFLNYL